MILWGVKTGDATHEITKGSSWTVCKYPSDCNRLQPPLFYAWFCWHNADLCWHVWPLIEKVGGTVTPVRKGLWSPCCALTGDVSTTPVNWWFPQCRSATLILKNHARPPENNKFQQSISCIDASGFISLGTFIWSLAFLLWKTFNLNPDVMQVSSPHFPAESQVAHLKW